MKFSLILPTYKVEKYITACLESCCNQIGFSLSEYEIIIVNDETPDNSISAAQKVIDRYPEHNRKIVNRKNGGLSAARNSGIIEAEGDYLWFIDSDDYIETNALSVLNDAVNKGDFDIINFTHKTVYKNNRIVGGDTKYNGYSTTGVEYMSQHGFLSAWTCIYKREFINRNNLKFKEGVIWEDCEFNTRAYMLSDNCYCISDALYYYIRREDSISDLKATPFSTQSRISNVYGLHQYFQTKKHSKRELGVAYSEIASILVGAIAGLPELTEKDRKYYRNEIRKHRSQYMQIMWTCGNLRKKLILISFWLFPVFSEQLLNKKTHEAIERSTK